MSGWPTLSWQGLRLEVFVPCSSAITALRSLARWNLPLQTNAPIPDETRKGLEGLAPACPLEANSRTNSANGSKASGRSVMIRQF